MSDWVSALEAVRAPRSDKLDKDEMWAEDVAKAIGKATNHTRELLGRAVASGVAVRTKKTKNGKWAWAYKLKK